MRRLITWLIMLPAAVAVVVFALHNKTPVVLDLWPFALSLEIELYLLLTAILGVGVLLGGVASWAGGGRLRAQLRKRTYDGEVARRQLTTEQAKVAELQVKLRAAEMQNLNTPDTGGVGDVKTIDHAPDTKAATTADTTAQLSGPKTAA
ncbi:lipopolysaccharide assembly protein LapA domain-containing protein [Magnetovibrio sp. PR-2]|uniref:lipopolysaccharide assembly protein LapA domain-containing protein n=1 Tax=Magnetovibrio sp. PR-2 TaxID=3120356 RepID=UPI002FCE3F2D